jgi:hypothetical protein
MKANSSPRLRSVPKLAPVARPKRTPKPPKCDVVSQVREALKPRNRLETTLGALLGGGVPVATYVLSHKEVVESVSLYAQLPSYLVLGGLVFSALTVYQWGKLAFSSGWKALGFAVLLEGVLTCSQTAWLSVGALAYLVAINGIATGCTLSRGGKNTHSPTSLVVPQFSS